MTVSSIRPTFPRTQATHLMTGTEHEQLLNFCAATLMDTSSILRTSDCHDQLSLKIVEGSKGETMTMKTGTDKPSSTTQRNATSSLLSSSTLFHTSSTSLHKSIFKRTNSELQRKVKCKELGKRVENRYQSPTDRLLSPCSQKLSKFRSKYIAAKFKDLTKAASTSNNSRLSFCASDETIIEDGVRVLRFK